MRELGQSKGYGPARTAAIASQLLPKLDQDAGECASCGRRGIVYDFAVDDQAVVWGVGSSGTGRLQWISPTRRVSQDLAFFNSEISSISVAKSHVVVATALINQGPGNVFLVSLNSLKETFDWSEYTTPQFRSLGPLDTTIWASAVNVDNKIAISSDRGMWALNTNTDTMQNHATPRAVKAVSWLSPNVVLGGATDGTVLLWDTRSGGKSQRFRHPTGVTGICSAGNDQQIVVSGFDGAALYDVRMPVAELGSKQKWPQRKPVSMPLWRVELATYYPIGAMDVWAEGKMLAIRDAASGDGEAGKVQIYSLTTGKHIATKSPPPDAGEGDVSDDADSSRAHGSLLRSRPRQTSFAKRNPEYVRRLRFAEDEKGNMALKGCAGGKLFEWKWGRDGDHEHNVEDDEEEGDPIVPLKRGDKKTGASAASTGRQLHATYADVRRTRRR